MAGEVPVRRAHQSPAPWLPRLVTAALWLQLLLTATSFLLHIAPFARAQSHGFVAYYTAGRLLRQGADANRFYDDAWFGTEVARYTPQTSDIYNINPPLTALLVLPLAGLDYETARLVWTVFNLLLLVTSTAFLIRQSGTRHWLGLTLMALLFLYRPLYQNFQFAQAYVLLLALLILAWWGYRTGREGVLGVALGLVLGLKTAGLFLWPLLLLQRRWRALLWGGLTVIALALVSLPWLGVEAWLTYFRLLPTVNRQPGLAVIPFQTVTGFFRHLFSFNPQWNPTPLSEQPELAAMLPVVALLLLLAASSYLAFRHSDQPDALFAAFAVLSVILSPVSLEYHYTLMWLPVMLAIMNAAEQRPGKLIALSLLAALILLAAPLPYLDRRLEVGARALLAYPRLYGGLLLWGVLLAQASRRPVPVASPVPAGTAAEG